MTSTCTIKCHEALKANPTAWALLRFVAYQDTVDDDGNPAKLELRNCSCGSTLAIELPTQEQIDETLAAGVAAQPPSDLDALYDRLNAETERYLNAPNPGDAAWSTPIVEIPPLEVSATSAGILLEMWIPVPAGRYRLRVTMTDAERDALVASLLAPSKAS